jgi:undecaprenyl-diphosphatase
MNLLHVLILAVVQGLCELLPVSSSAHVIMVEKMLGLDPSAPEMTMLLVMLHTGTMFAVIVYFWRAWVRTYFASADAFKRNVPHVVLATIATGIVGLALLELIKTVVAQGRPDFEIETLFGSTKIIASGLAAAGLLILYSSRRAKARSDDITRSSALLIGMVQGLCLPFRGFSRSGATISTGLAAGVGRQFAEQFSFALAVVLTPPVVVREAWRLFKSPAAMNAIHGGGVWSLVMPSLLGMVLSFVAGLLALRWLSRWLETDRWYLFGFYCIAASLLVFALG